MFIVQAKLIIYVDLRSGGFYLVVDFTDFKQKLATDILVVLVFKPCFLVLVLILDVLYG